VLKYERSLSSSKVNVARKVLCGACMVQLFSWLLWIHLRLRHGALEGVYSEV